MNATCDICGWSGVQGSWVVIRKPGPMYPRPEVMIRLCHRCGYFWGCILHQIDCDGCRQCEPGAQYNNPVLYEMK